jgi:hypothetical protein
VSLADQIFKVAAEIVGQFVQNQDHTTQRAAYQPHQQHVMVDGGGFQPRLSVTEVRRALESEFNHMGRRSFDQLRNSLEYAYGLNEELKTLIRTKRQLQNEIAAAIRIKGSLSDEAFKDIVVALRIELAETNNELESYAVWHKQAAEMVAEAELRRQHDRFNLKRLSLKRRQWLHWEIQDEILELQRQNLEAVDRTEYALEELIRDARGRALGNRAAIAARGQNAHFLLQQALASDESGDFYNESGHR